MNLGFGRKKILANDGATGTQLYVINEFTLRVKES